MRTRPARSLYAVGETGSHVTSTSQTSRDRRFSPPRSSQALPPIQLECLPRLGEERRNQTHPARRLGGVSASGKQGTWASNSVVIVQTGRKRKILDRLRTREMDEQEPTRRNRRKSLRKHGSKSLRRTQVQQRTPKLQETLQQRKIQVWGEINRRILPLMVTRQITSVPRDRLGR